MTIKKLHHIGVAVPEIETALAFWQDALGLELSHVDDVPEQEVVVAFFPTGIEGFVIGVESAKSHLENLRVDPGLFGILGFEGG